jgi:SAM-dependent methyltransferase
LDDIARLRREYEDRKRRLAGSDLYSLSNPANLFTIQGRQRAVLSALQRHGFVDLSRRKILEMGCGAGGVLGEYLAFGAVTCNLFGVDLLLDRLAQAHHWHSGLNLANADGQSLPFRSQVFDLVLQYTALSSVLDPELRGRICAEMQRVLKPDGLILSYDFWLNPTNPQTCGIRPAEIRRLFPRCQYEFHRITLAPPITRRLATLSWGLCRFLEGLKAFNTHYLVCIRPGV